jgi:uncharacterized protein YndB with AHSA1/START domain
MSNLPPVLISATTPLSVDAAFDLFFGRIGEWWPLATRSVALQNAIGCEVEQRVGGHILERTRDGQIVYWGTILVWEPPLRAVFTWHPGSPETMATEVEVRFSRIGQRSRVEIEHRHWERLGSLAAEIRGRYENGWVGVLRRFEERSKGADLTPTEGPGCGELMKKAAAAQSDA